MARSTIAFENGQIFEYRLGRAGRHNVNWGDWQTGSVYAQHSPAGECVCMVPEKPQGVTGWAEYDPRRDFCGENDGIALFLCEDYYMDTQGHDLTINLAMSHR
jgi:hypothetical protein